MEMRDVNRGDSNAITREYLDSLLIEERLIDSDLPDMRTAILGKEYETPIMSAAFSHLGSICPDAACEMAKGIRNAGALNWWGMSNDHERESIFATGCSTVQIIKPFADENKIIHEMEHAIALGAAAVGMDIDHAFGHDGGYDNVLGDEMRPKTAAQIKEYVSMAGKTPFVIKGVLSVQDAVKCAEAGAAGIMISHHHGVIAYAVPPLMLLPEIVKEVGSKAEVYVDCGMDSAMDVFKALALGASAVSVSRHILQYLKNGQADGVAQRIRAMTSELSSILAKTGCKRVRGIDPSIIREYRRTFA